MTIRRHAPPSSTTEGAPRGAMGSSTASRAQHYLGIVAFIVIVIVMMILPPLRRNKQLSADNMLAGGAVLLPADESSWQKIKKVLHERERSEVLHEDDDEEQSDANRQSRKKKIDLTLYVIFHRHLVNKMYEGVDWPSIELPLYQGDVQTNGFKRSARNTVELASALSSPEVGVNRTTILFVAANRHIKKHYDRALVEGRLLLEWELPGFDSRIGNQLNEFGVMNSIFASQLTQHAGNLANLAGRSMDPKLIAADADGDGVQEWIGVFQYDMPLDSTLIHEIRHRIERRTRLAWSAQKKRSFEEVHSEADVAKLKSAQLHCCIFYGFSFPTRSLLGNDLGRQLLLEYNQYFGTSFALSDLPRSSILDAFVVPNIVFNHISPFLEQVMLRFLRNNSAYPVASKSQAPRHEGAVESVAINEPPGQQRSSEPAAELENGASPLDTLPANSEVSVGGGNVTWGRRSKKGKTGSKARYPVLTVEERKKGNTVMEAALALVLGLETQFVQVQLPLRHATWKQ